jgi:hypothetical protein
LRIGLSLLRAASSQLSAQLFLRDGLGSILIEAGQPPGQFGLLGFRQRNIGIAQTVPKLAYQGKPFFGAKPREFVRIKVLHTP